MSESTATSWKDLFNADYAPLVKKVSAIVNGISGIQLGEKQASMVQSRLVRRITELGLANPHEYMDYIDKNYAAESQVLVSLLTTHHTYFFREFEQFSLLERGLLAKTVERLKAEGRRTLKIWSVACSRGQEVYSLAMFLHVHLPKIDPAIGYEIFGTDIDQESVKVAQNGVYRWSELKEAPAIYVENQWIRGTGEISDFVKAKDTIKKHCRFAVGNMLDLDKSPVKDMYDLIFCRNVFIYFTSEQIEAITKNLLKYLTPTGSLFIGMSESLSGMNLGLTYLGHSIYTRKEVEPRATEQDVEKTSSSVAIQAAVKPKNIRVLCVDDSPTVLTLLKKVLVDEHGFTVIGIAKNGIEAAKFPRNEYDVMTLDIHMPEMNGIEYLEKNFGVSHPPVVMLSSVSREESSLGIRSLELGAADYVEKPSLANLIDRAEEIRTKLRCAVSLKDHSSSQQVTSILTKSFARTIKISEPKGKLRVIVGSVQDRVAIVAMLKHMTQPQPPTIVILDNPESIAAQIGEAVSKESGVQLHQQFEMASMEVGHVYFQAYSALGEQDLHTAINAAKCSILVFSSVSAKVVKKLSAYRPKAQMILEDRVDVRDDVRNALISSGVQCVPVTSFLFDSDSFLEKP